MMEQKNIYLTELKYEQKQIYKHVVTTERTVSLGRFDNGLFEWQKTDHFFFLIACLYLEMHNSIGLTNIICGII